MTRSWRDSQHTNPYGNQGWPSVPLYLVWIERDDSLEMPAVHASTHPVAVGDVIVVERESCHVDRIEAAPDRRYDAVIHGHRE